MNRIETERLVLELYTGNDKDYLIGLLTDPAVMKHVDKGVLDIPQAESLWNKLVNEWYPQGVDTIWAVTAKDDGRYVGNASIHPRPERKQDWEIGYYLISTEWKKGFATELANRLVRYGFDVLSLPAIYATVDTDHPGSIHVLEKAGLSLFRSEYDEQGEFYVYRTIRA